MFLIALIQDLFLKKKEKCFIPSLLCLVRQRVTFFKKKILPLNFEEIIDAEVLALWFMDDDGLGGNTVSGLVLDVSAFTVSEQFLIKEILNKKFHLKTYLHTYNKEKNYVKLYFKKDFKNEVFRKRKNV